MDGGGESVSPREKESREELERKGGECGHASIEGEDKKGLLGLAAAAGERDGWKGVMGP
jgi:hypothetical protein